MAERTPKALASYEAEATTPLTPLIISTGGPAAASRAISPSLSSDIGELATITGFPASPGSSRCSTDAKKASISTWITHLRAASSHNLPCTALPDSTGKYPHSMRHFSEVSTERVFCQALAHEKCET